MVNSSKLRGRRPHNADFFVAAETVFMSLAEDSESSTIINSHIRRVQQSL
jgi:hypothetical protein